MGVEKHKGKINSCRYPYTPQTKQHDSSFVVRKIHMLKLLRHEHFYLQQCQAFTLILVLYHFYIITNYSNHSNRIINESAWHEILTGILLLYIMHIIII